MKALSKMMHSFWIYVYVKYFFNLQHMHWNKLISESDLQTALSYVKRASFSKISIQTKLLGPY